MVENKKAGRGKKMKESVDLMACVLAGFMMACILGYIVMGADTIDLTTYDVLVGSMIVLGIFIFFVFPRWAYKDKIVGRGESELQT